MKVKNVSLDQILEPAQEIRSYVTAEKLEDLAKSIQELGIIQPIVVAKKGDNWEIVAGHRRYLAAKMAGLADVPAVEIKEDHKKNDLITIHENLYREDVNPIDEAHWIKTLLEKYKYTSEALGRLLGKDGSYVRRRLMLLRGDPQVLEALKASEISLAQAEALNRFETPEQRTRYLRLTILNGATTKTIEGWRAQILPPGPPQENPRYNPETGAPYPNPQVPKRYCENCAGEEGQDPLQLVMLCPNCYNAFREVTEKERGE